MKADVHVLTLTATPIPRTFADGDDRSARAFGDTDTTCRSAGGADLCHALGPCPTARGVTARTFSRRSDPFSLCPRIADLPDIEEFFKEYAPEISYVVAHGQMPPAQVEERMSAFYDKKYDVLLSTTIVESGLDIPSANTLIIHCADRFGLAQLYQLRGRVGQIQNQGICLYADTAKTGSITETG